MEMVVVMLTMAMMLTMMVMVMRVRMMMVMVGVDECPWQRAHRWQPCWYCNDGDGEMVRW